jgi:hypothetical protein
MSADDPLLAAVLNLSRYHRDHEKFYAEHPREQAVSLQRHTRTLKALADRWMRDDGSHDQPQVPFAGSEDLNDPVALQLDGVLFMEGAGEPVELQRIKGELRGVAEQSIEIGEWLASAMEMTWAAATALFDYPPLADLLGERHRIIANDWQAANMSLLAGRLLLRALDILDRQPLTPDALRDDLANGSVTPGLLYSATELIDRAADLLSDSAGLVHDNERRWRTFRQRVEQVVSTNP